MPKTIDISKKTSVQTPEKTYGQAPEGEKEKPVKRETKVQPKQNFISRFLDIMLYDILHKFGLHPDKNEEQKRWEVYERFEKLTRGEK